MTKFFQNIRSITLAAAAIALAFASQQAPAKADDMISSKDLVGQLGLVGPQVSNAVANSTSYNNQATTTALGANLVDTSDITKSIGQTDANMSHIGSDIKVDSATIQIGAAASQNAAASANSIASQLADAKATAANIVNSSSITATINSNLSHH